MVNNMKKRYRLKKSVLIFLLYLIPISTMLVSIFQIGKWYVENNHNKESKKHTIEVSDISIEKNKDRYPFLKVDLSKLKEENSDTQGWLQVSGTNINYPVVQTKDNDFYLNHGFYKEYNSAGWVYMDYRNTLQDPVTIFYAHNRLDGSMFGSLKNAFQADWHKKSQYLYFSTDDEMNTYQIFSVYSIAPKDFKMNFHFASDEDYLNYWWGSVSGEKLVYSAESYYVNSDGLGQHLEQHIVTYHPNCRAYYDQCNGTGVRPVVEISKNLVTKVN